jgi:hypothetical protein
MIRQEGCIPAPGSRRSGWPARSSPTRSTPCGRSRAPAHPGHAAQKARPRPRRRNGGRTKTSSTNRPGLPVKVEKLWKKSVSAGAPSTVPTRPPARAWARTGGGAGVLLHHALVLQVLVGGQLADEGQQQGQVPFRGRRMPMTRSMLCLLGGRA